MSILSDFALSNHVDYKISIQIFGYAHSGFNLLTNRFYWSKPYDSTTQCEQTQREQNFKIRSALGGSNAEHKLESLRPYLSLHYDIVLVHRLSTK